MAEDNEEILESYAKIKDDVLIENHDMLVKDLDAVKFFPYLRAKRLFDEEDEEIIKHEITTKRKAQCFLNILAKKGPDAFDYFCEALVGMAGHQELLSKLLECLDRKLDEVRNQGHERSQAPPISHLPIPGDPNGPSLPSGFIQQQQSFPEPPPAYCEY